MKSGKELIPQLKLKAQESLPSRFDLKISDLEKKQNEKSQRNILERLENEDLESLELKKSSWKQIKKRNFRKNIKQLISEVESERISEKKLCSKKNIKPQFPQEKFKISPKIDKNFGNFNFFSKEDFFLNFFEGKEGKRKMDNLKHEEDIRNMLRNIREKVKKSRKALMNSYLEKKKKDPNMSVSTENFFQAEDNLFLNSKFLKKRKLGNYKKQSILLRISNNNSIKDLIKIYPEKNIDSFAKKDENFNFHEIKEEKKKNFIEELKLKIKETNEKYSFHKKTNSYSSNNEENQKETNKLNLKKTFKGFITENNGKMKNCNPFLKNFLSSKNENIKKNFLFFSPKNTTNNFLENNKKKKYLLNGQKTNERIEKFENFCKSIDKIYQNKSQKKEERKLLRKFSLINSNLLNSYRKLDDPQGHFDRVFYKGLK